MDDRPHATWERYSAESDHEWAAFVFYRDNRPMTLDELSTRLGIARSTIGLWSSEWVWRERVADYDRHVDRVRLRATETAVQKMNRKHLTLLDSARQLVAKEIRKRLKRAEHEDMTDAAANRLLDLVIKYERLIRGEATERPDLGPRFDASRLSDEELARTRELLRKGTTED